MGDNKTKANIVTPFGGFWVITAVACARPSKEGASWYATKKLFPLEFSWVFSPWDFPQFALALIYECCTSVSSMCVACLMPQLPLLSLWGKACVVMKLWGREAKKTMPDSRKVKDRVFIFWFGTGRRKTTSVATYIKTLLPLAAYVIENTLISM